MRILIATAGSRGDVAPYTGLGAALRRAGYDVAVATTDTFARMVRDAGLGFRRLPADTRGHAGVRSNREVVRAAGVHRGTGPGLRRRAVSEGTDLLLLSTTTAPLGWLIGEATGIRSLGVYLQPTAPTADFPPVVTGARSLGRLGNRTAGRLALRMADRIYAEAVAGLRERLCLPPLSAAAMRARQERAGWPVLHGFGTALVPRPADWRPGLEVVGPWWPHHDAGERLPSELEDFLDAGPRPVLVGFGSMAAGDGERLSELAVRALRRAGLRGILQSGNACLAAEGDDVLTVGDVPHALLFPRLAAVVHHGGAGTRRDPAGGRPLGGGPGDRRPEPFWAGRLARIGAAPAPVPFTTLTADGLAGALGRVVGDEAYARAAEKAARHLAAEDGAARV
uniref:UDP-glucose:sterol glycosyltransferase n=1 Tax=Micromonospora echinospora TaxID=1877 RepID=A0A0U2VIX4_MICEC|nr:UDP-glucose:sterol glycosyltransferase [Micromonospora echinospora]